MQKKKAPPTLKPKELDVIHMLFGVGSPSGSDDMRPLEPRMTEAEVKTVEERVLRKLRHMRLENLTQLRRAG